MKRLIPLLLASLPAYAAPPPGSDGSLAPWYHSLAVPESGGMCCDIADCRNVQAEIRGDGFWWAWVDSKTFPDEPSNGAYGHAPNAWVKIPDGAVLKRHDNPTGEAVLCYFGGGVRCFVPASGA